MITNTDTQEVALKWAINQRNPPPVKIDGTDRMYFFTPRQNVFMAWVKPEDVSRLLKQKAKVCNCSNGTYREAFVPANRLDVLLWETGSRDGQLNSNYVEE